MGCYALIVGVCQDWPEQRLDRGDIGLARCLAADCKLLPQNIAEVYDGGATRSTVLRALDGLLDRRNERRTSEEGGEEEDTLLIHYGGHGKRTEFCTPRQSIVDGAVRDVEKMTAMGFAVFARGTSVYDSQDRQRVCAIDVEVKIDGVAFASGDLVFADEDGVVVVPGAIEAEAIAAAWQKVHDENITRDAIRDGMKATDAYQKYGGHDLNFGEFQTIASDIGLSLSEERARHLFDTADHNSNGKITYDEFDAHVLYPVMRVSLSACDVQQPQEWVIRVNLATDAPMGEVFWQARRCVPVAMMVTNNTHVADSDQIEEVIAVSQRGNYTWV